MNAPRPCALLWLARDYVDDRQHDAYMQAIRSIPQPQKRSDVVVVHEDEPLKIDDLLSDVAFYEQFDDAVLSAAKRKGFSTASFAIVIYFREIEKAAVMGPDVASLVFIGRFEFPFPERGDHISRYEHGWLGIDAAYCTDEEPDTEYIGREDNRPLFEEGEPIEALPTESDKPPETGIIGKFKRLFQKPKNG